MTEHTAQYLVNLYHELCKLEINFFSLFYIGPWEIIPSIEPTPFKDAKYTCVIPHSEYIQSCHDCNSTGRKRFVQSIVFEQ